MKINRMLKIVIPNKDPRLIDMMSVDQVNHIPPRARDFLFSLGETEPLGDMEILRITKATPDQEEWISQSIAWITKGDHAQFLKDEDLKVRPRGCWQAEPITYFANVHNQSLEVTTTKETGDLFAARMDLYIFSIRSDFDNLQHYLSDRICSSHYPIYEREIRGSLIKLAKESLAGDLRLIDAQLDRYIFDRAALLVGELEGACESTGLLLALREFFSDREQHSALVPFSCEEVIKQATQSFRENLSPSTELRALLRHKVPKHDNRAHALADLFGSVSDVSSVRDDSIPLRSEGTPSIDADDTARVGHSKRRRLCGPEANDDGDKLALTVHGKRHRRPRPSTEDFDFSNKGPKHIKPTRPLVDGEYWSVAPARWHGFSAKSKKAYTHIGLICETDLGMTLEEPCDSCKDRGRTCDVYVDDDDTATAGKQCASCRMIRIACSLVGN